MLQRKYMEKNRSIAHTVSIEAVLRISEKISSTSEQNSMKNSGFLQNFEQNAKKFHEILLKY